MSFLCLISLVAACSRGENAAGDSAAVGTAGAAPAPCPGDNAGLTLPAGFCATVFADSLGDPRHVVVAPNGDVYATLEGRRPSPEKRMAGETQQRQRAAVIALRDTTGDGRADVTARVPGVGNTGIGLHGDYLYVDEGPRIVRYRRQANDLAPSGAREMVVSELPFQPGHVARNFTFGPDGALYVNVGSATNSCQRRDRAAASPGIDPCTELERRAGIWRFDASATNQRFSPQARFAAGNRNAMGLAVNPADGLLYATQHGRDQLHDNWRAVFPSTEYQAENPAEELMQVSQGDAFGWPYCYYSVEEKKLVTAPEYGGDGKKAERCERLKGPVAVFPGHWAPMSLLFYTGTQFPARYRQGAFIAFHGSWNRAPRPQAGYNVVFQPMAGGRASGDFEVFADGFAGLPPAEIQPDRARHRPAGLAQAPDGALFITDDAGGRIYRVTYGAGRE